MSKTEKISITSILGSLRKNGSTAKALNIVKLEIESHPKITYQLIDPGDYQLAFPGQEPDKTSVSKLQRTVVESTGIVLATPEYHGSYSSIMKLVIDNLGYPSVLAGKPVVLLGVASGRIGAIKALEHLRSVCSHVGAIVLPGIVSVANVDDVFDPSGRCLDANAEKRIRAAAKCLISYIEEHICPSKTLEEYLREKS